VTVTTVLGEVAATDLGVVLPHEHLIANACAEWEPPETLAELRASLTPISEANLGRAALDPTHYRSVLQSNDALAVVEELELFAAAGGRTVVDLGPPGFGRDPCALKAISQLTSLHVVMGCGEYRQASHSGYVAVATESQIADVLIRELTVGVQDTGIRAGIIGELGTGNPITDDERKVLRAAAIAQRDTGAAINIHRTPFPDPDACLEALDILFGAGVDPARVAMSHCDERTEVETAIEVGRRGAFISLDTFGMERWATGWRSGGQGRRSYDEERVEILLRLLDAGYCDQILLSHDVCMQTQLTRHGGWGYAHLSVNIEPRLLAAGLEPEDLRRLRVENPRRLLAGDSGS